MVDQDPRPLRRARHAYGFGFDPVLPPVRNRSWSERAFCATLYEGGPCRVSTALSNLRLVQLWACWFRSVGSMCLAIHTTWTQRCGYVSTRLTNLCDSWAAQNQCLPSRTTARTDFIEDVSGELAMGKLYPQIPTATAISDYTWTADDIIDQFPLKDADAFLAAVKNLNIIRFPGTCHV